MKRTVGFSFLVMSIACGGPSSSASTTRTILTSSIVTAQTPTGCSRLPDFKICEVPSGSAVNPDGTVTMANGEVVEASCTDPCSPTGYAMRCYDGSNPLVILPVPPAVLNCTSVPVPTPSNVLFYCCTG